MKTVAIRFTHPDERDPAGDVCEDVELEVALEYEGGGVEGQDADGNRGRWVDGYFQAFEWPEICPECGRVFTKEDGREIARIAEEAAQRDEEGVDPWDGPDTVEEDE